MKPKPKRSMMYLEDLKAWRRTFLSDRGKTRLFAKEVRGFMEEGRIHLDKQGKPLSKKGRPQRQAGEHRFGPRIVYPSGKPVNHSDTSPVEVNTMADLLDYI